VTGGEQITLDSASDRIREFMHLFAAEQERGKGSERSRRVKAQAAKAGRSTGKRLFGYTKSWEIDPSEADIEHVSASTQEAGTRSDHRHAPPGRQVDLGCWRGLLGSDPGGRGHGRCYDRDPKGGQSIAYTSASCSA